MTEARPNSGKFLRFWFPVILYSAIIFYASSLPDVKLDAKISHLDKVVHVLAYAVYALLLGRAVYFAADQKFRRMLFACVVLGTIAYGISDEFHQSFVPGRDASLGDLLADAIGAGFGYLIFRLFYRDGKGLSRF